MKDAELTGHHLECSIDSCGMSQKSVTAMANLSLQISEISNLYPSFSYISHFD